MTDNLNHNASAHQTRGDDGVRPRVLVDVDGVLADFVSGYLGIVEAVTGRDFKPENVTQFDIGASLGLTPEESALCGRALSKAPGFCEALEVYPGAQDGIAALQKIADVYIVTSPWNSCPTWTYERERWLKRHFDIPSSRVIHTSAKHVCRGDFLVDDKVSAVRSWHQEHPRGVGVVWDTPHNQLESFPARTRNWSVLRIAVAQRARVLGGLRELAESAPPPEPAMEFDLSDQEAGR